MSDLQLKTGGTLHAGWKTIRVQLGMRRFADTFELTLTERWPGEVNRRTIEEDAPCQILIDDELVITGFVDDVETTYNDQEHTVSVVGRARTGDLVDCGHEGDSWNVPMKLERLATELCRPYGIKVKVEADTGEPLNNPIIEVGETPHEFLARLATYRGVMLTSNTNGDLVITRASKRRIATALVLGENIKRASGKRSKQDRFHSYTVTGQHSGENDESYGADASKVIGKATDDHIRKARTTVIVADTGINLNDAKLRAEHERNVRYGESRPTTYTTNGWRHKDGLWLPNRMVPVVDAYMGIDEDRLITHVTYSMGEEGELAELEVMPREALDTIALPEPKTDEEVRY